MKKKNEETLKKKEIIIKKRQWRHKKYINLYMPDKHFY